MLRLQPRRVFHACLVLVCSALACGQERTPNLEFGVHRAVQAEDLLQVRLLLEAGSDPNEIDDEGRTPLHVASDLGLWPIQ